MSLTNEDIISLQNKVDGIKAIAVHGESCFRELSYLKTFVKELMQKQFTKKEENHV